MVMSALVLYGYGLLHKTSFFELVAVDKRSTETPLLVRCKALCEVGVDFARRVALSRQCSIIRGMLVLVIRVIDVIASLGDGRPSAFLTFALCTA